MPGPNHQDQEIKSVPCVVLTVSDTRTVETDRSGKLICDLLTGCGHEVCDYRIVKDDPDRIRELLRTLRDDGRCATVLINGGTGLSPRDTTYEAVVDVLDKRLDGFGELFRMKSFAEIGSAAMLSRAVAGVMGRCVVFSMPGSPAAVRLAMNELIIPELGHIAYLVAGTQPQG